MNYQIVEVRGRETIPYLVNDEPVMFHDGTTAAGYCRDLSALRNAKFQPRKINKDDAWREREEKRLADGTYKPVIWADEPWWKAHHIAQHYAHIAQKDPTRIAYTDSAEKGMVDIQTRIKPGRYLEKFFGNVLSPTEIKQAALRHLIQFETLELKFATTPDDIEHVYDVGPESCMSGSKWVRCYGAGDLAVAYLEHNGRITARSVCWPDRKIYVAVYGDEDRLQKLLQAAGYKQEYGRSYSGARLLRSFHDESGWLHLDFGYNDFDTHSSREFVYIR